MIEPNQFYRLPTDREWMLASDLPEEEKTEGDEALITSTVTELLPWDRMKPPP